MLTQSEAKSPENKQELQPSEDVRAIPIQAGVYEDRVKAWRGHLLKSSALLLVFLLGLKNRLAARLLYCTV